MVKINFNSFYFQVILLVIQSFLFESKLLYISEFDQCNLSALREIDNSSENPLFDVLTIGFWFRFKQSEQKLIPLNQNIFSFDSPNSERRISLKFSEESFIWDLLNQKAQKGFEYQITKVDMNQLQDSWIFVYYSHSFTINQAILFLRISKHITETTKSYFLSVLDNISQSRLDENLILTLGERNKQTPQCPKIYYFNPVVSFDPQHRLNTPEKLNQFMIFGFQIPPLNPDDYTEDSQDSSNQHQQINNEDL